MPRGPGGQFTSVQGVPVEIVSGVRVGFSGISQSVRRAAVNALVDGIDQALLETQRTIALDTGSMRGAFWESVSGEIGSLFTSRSDSVELDWSEIERHWISAVNYAKHHIVGHPQFNPDFAGGYTHPTTTGTKPLNPTSFMGLVYTYTDAGLEDSLAREALEVR